MYGLVNRAVEQMVVSNFGEPTWLELCRRADVSPTTFVAQTVYDDAITYRLVATASEMLSVPAEEVLKQFGEFWILFTASEGYGALLSMCGDNLFDFLDGMNEMHARIEGTFHEMRPPHFEMTRMADSMVELHYHSEREGLAPMVVGLLTGLARRFGQTAAIEHVQQRASAGHDVFRIQVG